MKLRVALLFGIIMVCIGFSNVGTLHVSQYIGPPKSETGEIAAGTSGALRLESNSTHGMEAPSSDVSDEIKSNERAIAENDSSEEGANIIRIRGVNGGKIPGSEWYHEKLKIEPALLLNQDPFQTIQDLGVKLETTGRVVTGIRVGEVKRGSLVEKIGLRPDDVIQDINGQAVNSPFRIPYLVTTAISSDSFNLRIVRDGKDKNITIDPDLMGLPAVQVNKALETMGTVRQLASMSKKLYYASRAVGLDTDDVETLKQTASRVPEILSKIYDPEIPADEFLSGVAVLMGMEQIITSKK